MQPPKYSSQGFTLLEMLAVLIVVGIIMGFAVPSLLSLNKPLRDGTVLFKNQLSLVRSKAISSNQAYRLKPKYPTRAEYAGGIPSNFVVEYARNCRVATTGANGWQAASQLDLDLPSNVGITDIASSTFGTSSGTVTIDNDLNWYICFDNRGLVDTTSKQQLVLKDFQGNNRAKIAAFNISLVGGVDIFTYTDNTANNYPVNTDLTDGQNPPNPTF
jgi:prepilin-type N-terminal cleavage/methylation domain-containing protein